MPTWRHKRAARAGDRVLLDIGLTGLAVGLLLTAAPAEAQAAPVAGSLTSAPSPDRKVATDPATLPVEPQSAAPSATAVVAPPVQSLSQPIDTSAQQADIVVRARKHTPGDPLGAVNAQSFALTASVDNAVGGPLRALSNASFPPNPQRNTQLLQQSP